MTNKRDPIIIQMPEELHTAIGIFLAKYPFVPFSSFTKTMVEEIINKPDEELVPFIQHKYLKTPRELKPNCVKNAKTSDLIRERSAQLTVIARRFKPNADVSFAALARYAWRQLISLPETTQVALMKKYFPNQDRKITRRNKHEKPIYNYEPPATSVMPSLTSL